MKHRIRHVLGTLLVVLTLFSGLIPRAFAQDGSPVASPVAQPASPLDSTISNVDLDVLVIGAHPDDEAFGLATYGQWNEYADAEVGVITVTRGEGGGNAVGTEEGPALGLLREREERNAVSAAGISHIYNLDKVDFYYTVSAPLTAQTWDYNDTLSRVVRVIRATTPDIIITMNPSPTPGNHGNHQLAARLAIDGYLAAADGTQFADDGFEPWSVDAIYQGGANGQEAMGQDCGTTFKPADPTDTVFGVWQGTPS
jgi:LmbE family N-acetylglucosaminyl deacetylase